jgi:hypothetical protein
MNLKLCNCGGGGTWLDLQQKTPESLKYISLTESQILKKCFENLLENALYSVSYSFGFLTHSYELKNHYMASSQKNTNLQIRKLKQENQD